MVAEPHFDRIARPYRWLEYATLGRALERTREYFLPRLNLSHQAFIPGDGDGRFTARLLAINPSIQIEAVDISAAMLSLLQQRVEALGQAQSLRIHHASALTHPPRVPPDLIVTHFFLDCLTQKEVEALASRLVSALTPGGLWLVSDFRIPTGLMRVPARILVRSLYFAFRILTGLRTTALPDHASALQSNGLVLIDQHHSLFGLLTSELWQKPPNS